MYIQYMINTQNGFDDFDTKVTAEEYYLSEGYTPEMAEELAAQDASIPRDDFYEAEQDYHRELAEDQQVEANWRDEQEQDLTPLA